MSHKPSMRGIRSHKHQRPDHSTNEPMRREHSLTHQQQGMSWFLRKALPYATVTLYVHEYPDSENPKVYHIDVDQVITGGITGSKEVRRLDWEEREHVDNIFGTLQGRSRFFRGEKGEDGKVRPAVDIQTQVGEPEADARVKKFLRGEVLVDGSACDGFLIDDEGAEFGEGEGLFMQSFVVNQEMDWTAEQVSCLRVFGMIWLYDEVLIIFRSGALRASRESVATPVVLPLPRTVRLRWLGLFTLSRAAVLRRAMRMPRRVLRSEVLSMLEPSRA